MSDGQLLQDTIDFNAAPGTGDSAVLHRAMGFFLREGLGATKWPEAPNINEQRKMLPILEGFAKAMLLCASGDGELADAERNWILGFVANSGATYELLEELRTLQPGDLNPMDLLQKTERPGLFTHALIYYAIKASDADGVLDPSELGTIKLMAQVLGVDEGTVDSLVDFHREEQAFQTRKTQLLFPNGHPWG